MEKKEATPYIGCVCSCLSLSASLAKSNRHAMIHPHCRKQIIPRKDGQVGLEESANSDCELQYAVLFLHIDHNHLQIEHAARKNVTTEDYQRLQRVLHLEISKSLSWRWYAFVSK